MVADSTATEPALARRVFERSAGTESEPKASANAGEQAPARGEETARDLDGPQRFKVQFTASEEYVALVEEEKALLAHPLPRADLAEIHLRAIRTLVAELKKRKFATSTTRTKRQVTVASLGDVASLHDGASSRSGAARNHAGAVESFRGLSLEGVAEPPRQRDSKTQPRRGRHVPAAVRRAVFERDGNRCAYVDSRGERCRETARLEFHHHEPFARGGPTACENLSLYCAVHNALAAEQDFGREFATAKREESSHFTERSVASRSSP
jgi:hypothetical protein